MVKGKFRVGENGYLSFWCPACEEMHSVRTKSHDVTLEGGWDFNEDYDSPTLWPSVLVKSGHYARGFKPGDRCWCSYEWSDGDPKFKCTVCHSFVENGEIRYLSDCTHAMAGQTVEMQLVSDGC